MLVEPSPKLHRNCVAFWDRLLKISVRGAGPSPRDMLNSALGGLGVAVGRTAVGVGRGVGVSGIFVGDDSVSVGTSDGDAGTEVGVGAIAGAVHVTTVRITTTAVATALNRMPHPLDFTLVNDVSRAVEF